MRRPPILLALAVLGALLASCGKGGHAASNATSPAGANASGGPQISKQRALAFASAVNLTRADVPGFTAAAKQGGESTSEKQLERDMLRCAGIAGTEKGLAESSSQSFTLKRGIVDLGVSSEVGVERTAAQAERGLTAIRNPHVRGCFSHYLEQVFKGKKFGGATIGTVTIQSGNPPAPGTSGGFGWRVTATFSVRGIKVPVYLDFLGFVDGPAEVTLLSSGLLQPFPAEVEQRLFALLLARAKAHRL